MKRILGLKRKYISQNRLGNLAKFTYSSINDSIFYNKFMSPFLDKVVIKRIPRWIAPNVLTILSFLFNLISSLAFFFETGNNHSIEVSKYTCLLNGITHTLYMFLDNLDGKQARRTNSSSPLGLLLDHGLDTLTTCLVCFNLSRMMMLGNGLTSLALYAVLILGFYFCVYEEYIVGYLNLWYINGADEGNLMIAFFSYFTAISGPKFWRICLYKGYNLAHLAEALLLIGTVQCLFHCLISIGKRRIDNINKFFTGSSYLFASYLLAFITYFVNFQFYTNHTTLLYALISLVFSRITIDLQVKIVTLSRQKTNELIKLTITVWIIILPLLYTKLTILENFCAFLLYSLAGLNAIALSHYIVSCAHEIKTFLKINILTINGEQN